MWIRRKKGFLVASLLDALDGFILIMRKTQILLLMKKIEAAEHVLNIKIQQFINNFDINIHHRFSDIIKNKIDILKVESKIDRKLDSCLEIISSLFPSLEGKYKKFYKYSTDLEWGNLL